MPDTLYLVAKKINKYLPNIPIYRNNVLTKSLCHLYTSPRSENVYNFLGECRGGGINKHTRCTNPTEERQDSLKDNP